MCEREDMSMELVLRNANGREQEAGVASCVLSQCGIHEKREVKYGSCYDYKR